MPFKIKNWKLALLALALICLFVRLGIWQLARAQEKTLLLQSFADRAKHQPLTTSDLQINRDWRFYPAQLQGLFDNAHTILLDNKIFHGQVGYEVYTPFHADGLSAPILIDRGFVPLVQHGRRELPVIRPIMGSTSITGMINRPPAYVAFGQMTESPQITWPLRVEYIQDGQLSNILGGQALFPYILSLNPKDKAAYDIEWQIVTMGPEKHRGYAVQWFAFALTLLILSVALNCERR